MTKKRVMVSGLVAAMLTLLGACQSATVSVGALDTPVPVLIGPVLLLKNAAHAPPVVGARFSGSVTAVMSEPRRQSDNDELDTDFIERMGSQDDLSPAMKDAQRTQPGKAIYIERLNVVDAVHWTALFIVDKRLQAEGYTFQLPRKKRLGVAR